MRLSVALKEKLLDFVVVTIILILVASVGSGFWALITSH